MEVWRYGALKPRDRCSEEEERKWRFGGELQVERHGGMEVQAYRRESLEVWSSGALEACCRCSDVETCRYGGTL